MIARLKPLTPDLTPVTEISELRTESDVEQKLLYPFLCHPSYLGLPSEWVRTKDYMEPTQIDKGAGKRYGYIPDYSIWKTGFPLAIVEAKSPEENIDGALREARLYATEINKRYPPNINPIAYILASNGKQFALTQWDSETEIIYATPVELQPGTAVLAAFRHLLNKEEFAKSAERLDRRFRGTRFHRVPALLGASRVSEQMGINSFAQELFPVVTKYFGTEADEASDDIIDRGYVSSEERGEYDAVLETYLKDRARVASDGRLEPITTNRSNASGISREISVFAQNPKYYGRVQLIVGGVGAGKSIFIRRFYRRLLPKNVDQRRMWGFLNFNVVPPGTFDRPGAPGERLALREWIVDEFVKSLQEANKVNVTDLEIIERIFAPEIRQFDRGPAKLLQRADEKEYAKQKYAHLSALRLIALNTLQGLRDTSRGNEDRAWYVCLTTQTSVRATNSFKFSMRPNGSRMSPAHS